MSWFSNEPRNPPKKKIKCVTCGNEFKARINSDGTIRVITCPDCKRRQKELSL